MNNLSTKDTIGTSQSVHNIEVSLVQRLISTVMYYIGTEICLCYRGVLIIFRVSLLRCFTVCNIYMSM